MLSAKPWRFEAVARLCFGVIFSVFAGSMLLTALQFSAHERKAVLTFYTAFGLSLACVVTGLYLLHRPWRLENAVFRLALTLFCLYAGFFLGAWAQKAAHVSFRPSITQMVVGSLSFQGAVLVLVVPFLREHGQSWSEGFGLRNEWRKAVVMGFIVACLFLPLGWTLQWVSAKVIVHLPLFHLKPEEQQAVQTLQLAGTWAPRVVLGIITILLAPMAEEVLFRGILYPWIKHFGYPNLALWGSAVLFAAVHMNLVTFVPLAVLALALALLYERTGNLLASIVAHAVFNGFNFALLYLFEDPLNKMS